MPLTIVPYTRQLEPAVRAFNDRLRIGHVTFQFPDRSVSDEASLNATIVNRGFVALHDDGTVRGGYLIKEQDFWLNGRTVRIGYLRLPLSEGLIDRRFGALGLQLILDALKRQPLLFGLGIGGADEALARLVTALRWRLRPVPFLFKVVRPFRTARGLAALRRSWPARVVADTAAWTGMAWLAVRSAQARLPVRRGSGHIEIAKTLGEIADQHWEAARHRYRLVGRRDAATLARLYESGDRDYLKFVMRSVAGRTAWAVALDTQMRDDKYFGRLRIGTIVDCLGDPDDAAPLMAAVTRALARRGVDVVISNQSSAIWSDALRRAGFSRRPSNFLFAASPALTAALGSLDSLDAFHLTRGDGDGPIHL